MFKRIISAILTAALLMAASVPAAAEAADTGTDTAVTEEASGYASSEDFLADIVQAFGARRVVEGRYTNSELNEMTDREYIEAHLACAEAERRFYNQYSEAAFEDLNIQYLCGQYCKGLELEYSC